MKTNLGQIAYLAHYYQNELRVLTKRNIRELIKASGKPIKWWAEYLDFSPQGFNDKLKENRFSPREMIMFYEKYQFLFTESVDTEPFKRPYPQQFYKQWGIPIYRRINGQL